MVNLNADLQQTRTVVIPVNDHIPPILKKVQAYSALNNCRNSQIEESKHIRIEWDRLHGVYNYLQGQCDEHITSEKDMNRLTAVSYKQ